MDAKYKILVIILVLVSFGCQPKHDSRILKFSGTLELTEHALGSKVAGRVATMTVDEGDYVTSGQLLATMDRYEQAQKDYVRSESLLKKGGATQQSLEYAALLLDDQKIISPIDGVVLVKVHEVGETVSAGSAVVVVGDRSKLWVKIFVPEGLINSIHLNQPAALFFDGLKQSFKGHVNFIAPQAEFTPRNVQTQEERITQAFAVKVILDEPSVNLRPGVAADVLLKAQPEKK